MRDLKQRVLLVYPVLKKTGVRSIHEMFPTGLLYIASALNTIDIHVDLFDMRRDKVNNLHLKDYLFIGITMLTGKMINNGLKVAKFIKESNNNIPIVAGGVHVSALPEQTLKSNLIDFVVIGEGEETIQELAVCLMKNSGYSEIKGLAYKENNNIFINPPRDFLDMDTLEIKLPYMLLGIEKDKINYIPLHTSRGCPNRCSFCYSPAINKRRYRTKSPSRLIEELEYILKTYKNVKFIDFACEDEFFINPKRVFPLLEYIVKNNISIKWNAFCRFDTLERIDDESLDLIRKSGCALLSFGAESGSQRLLDEIVKKDIQVDQIIRGVERLDKAKIPHGASFMCCLPTETIVDLNLTISLLTNLHQKHPYFYSNGLIAYAPLPGTSLYNLLIDKYNYTPPSSIEEWSKFEMPAKNSTWVTWQRNDYSKFCQHLSNWSCKHRPFQYFGAFETYRNKYPLIHLPKFIFKLIRTIQQLRIKCLNFKYPIELVVASKINFSYRFFGPIFLKVFPVKTYKRLEAIYLKLRQY